MTERETIRVSKKRSKNRKDMLMYKDWEFVQWERESNAPGTPHRYFQDVYTVRRKINDLEGQNRYQQVVHRHANGLAIITAGDTVSAMLRDFNQNGDRVAISSFMFNLDVTESPTSVGGKRKKARKMKSGQVQSETVLPGDTLATVFLTNGQSIGLKCCVAGTLLETNVNLNAAKDDLDGQERCSSLLQNDPLLDGYLAIILPLGDFPE